QTIFSKKETGSATFYAKENGVISGTTIIKDLYQILDTNMDIKLFKEDGDIVKFGDKIAHVSGSIRAILSGERIILNLLQRMSGIATQTAKAIEILNNPTIKIVDTRKTSPGLRMFEKY